MENIIDKKEGVTLTGIPSSTNDTRRSNIGMSMDDRFRENEKIMKQFVEFEEQALQFD